VSHRLPVLDHIEVNRAALFVAKHFERNGVSGLVDGALDAQQNLLRALRSLMARKQKRGFRRGRPPRPVGRRAVCRPAIRITATPPLSVATFWSGFPSHGS